MHKAGSEITDIPVSGTTHLRDDIAKSALMLQGVEFARLPPMSIRLPFSSVEERDELKQLIADFVDNRLLALDGELTELAIYTDFNTWRQEFQLRLELPLIRKNRDTFLKSLGQKWATGPQLDDAWESLELTDREANLLLS